MGILDFFMDAKKVIILFTSIALYTILLDIKSVIYFFDIIVIGGVFWFGLSLAAIKIEP